MLQDRELPQPGVGELLVEVRAAGVNPFDVKFRSRPCRHEDPIAGWSGVGGLQVVAALGRESMSSRSGMRCSPSSRSATAASPSMWS